VCDIGLAVSRKYRTKEGEQREETLFINVDVWAKQAEYCGQNLSKGRPILVEGQLRSDEWEDKNTGQRRTAIKVSAARVQHLDWEDRPGGGGRSGGSGGAAPSRSQGRDHEEPAPDDDIPF
jgi:single-strand DNA-binding protein